MASARQKVLKEVKFCGLLVRPDAVRKIVQVVEAQDDQDEAVLSIMSALKTKASAGVAVDAALVKQVVDSLSETSGATSDHDTVVIDAFSMAHIKYNTTRCQYFKADAPRKPTAKQYCGIFRERFVLLRQRLMRNPLFAEPIAGIKVETHGTQRRRVAANKQSGKQQGELTPIESLVASSGPKCVLGLISRLGDGNVYLEDLNGRIQMNLEEASFGRGLITEGCIVLAEGVIRDGLFVPINIMSPMSETRADSMAAHGGLDFIQGKAPLSKSAVEELVEAERQAPGNSFVFMSDVHIDLASTHAKLRLLLQGCSSMPVIPSVFVFMGNFTERPFGETEGQCSMDEFIGHMDELANILLEYPKILEAAQFVFVPGPQDPGFGSLLPRPRLPQFLTSAFEAKIAEKAPGSRVTFTSNPARLQYCSQEIVLFREDLLAKLRRHCLHDPSVDLSAEEHLCRTIVEQSHLCPLPLHVRPIAWTHDNALRLYPLPHLVVTGDRYDQFSCAHQGTTVCNPGSFSIDGSFVMYVPHGQQVHFSKVQAQDPEDPEELDDAAN
mmetsp:Transcript_23326/g.41248  ORF Transcript_23326/g.41248 Transcript_23326/m.41248 type:complete len:553 (-) Transcript_23326:124-1782(-)|eukprot:CAMPEP_0184561062 /NCGR_PEP_ID=MMETSP0199_2-20130426/47252_1 /TAXON_ID=1112570 /ORGANISM="Thraustochytrium sp., Strain LLF1b" /LENGTH=552 /DNA_ID=CAMNT_0026958373 /DNA_START=123 /DNA_END=1781 /DNA_ORIENTATION=+